MKKEIPKSSQNQKISAMVLKVAEGYIDMGETREEKENYLRSACSAWNIACLPPFKRESSIKQYIEQYRKINQADAAECKPSDSSAREEACGNPSRALSNRLYTHEYRSCQSTGRLDPWSC